MREEVVDQYGILRRYLLGELPDDEQQEVEAQLLVNNEYLEQMLIAEEDLVDEYLSGRLPSSQRNAYETRFLATRDGHQKIRVTRALQNHLKKFRAPTPSPFHRVQAALKFIVSPTALKVAAALLILALGVLNWSLFFRQSDLKRGITALSDAYREQRPVEARITGLPYAPFSGAPHNQSNAVKMKAADKAFHNLNGKDRSPAALHALGRYFITEKNFREAIIQLSDGLKAAPEDVSLHIDLAVAFMELAKTESGEAKGKDFAASRTHLEEALKQQPASLEALFNLALLHQTRNSWKEAEEGWRRYLAADSTSSWTQEAQRYLNAAVEAQKK